MSQRALLIPLLCAGCFDEVWADSSALFPDATASGTSSSTTGATTEPGEGSGGPVETVTGGPPTASTSSGGGPPASASTSAPGSGPVIIAFELSQDVLMEAGAAVPSAVVSEDVVELQLAVDGAQAWAGPPGPIGWSFVATSAGSNGEYELVLTARDDEGLEATASAKLWVTLPPSGAEKCVFSPDATTGWLNAAVYGADALTVAGALALPELEATLWRLDPNSCQPLAGSPWSISQWAEDPLVKPPSQAVGLATDALGRTAVAANLGVGLARRAYVALLSPAGELEWEDVGPIGHTYSGIAAAPGRVVVVGELMAGEMPPRYDGLIESFDVEEGTKLWSDTLAAPLPGDDWTDLDNLFEEHPRGVVWNDSESVIVVVGDRQVPDDKDMRVRAFAAQYTLNGALVAAWTSVGADAENDGLSGVGMCGSEVVAGGWIQDGQAARAPATRWIDALGDGGKKRRLDALKSTTIQSLACDLEEKFTAAATSDVAAYALGFRGSDDPFVFKLEFAKAILSAADCDARGFCVVAGLKGDRPWARVNHP